MTGACVERSQRWRADTWHCSITEKGAAGTYNVAHRNGSLMGAARFGRMGAHLPGLGAVPTDAAGGVMSGRKQAQC